ncbi:hypothetical protein EBR57_07490 [bacterium]|nr:hypothetical protein [bacterium]
MRHVDESAAAGPFAVTVAFVFTAAVFATAVCTLLGRPAKPLPEHMQLEQLPDNKTTPAPDTLVADPAPFYRQGYETGYYAFLSQSGSYAPPPKALTSVYTVAGDVETETAPAVDALTTEVDLIGVDAEAAYDLGYTAGYHKATESMHCPRYNYGR